MLSNSLHIFLVFLKRDAYIVGKRALKHLINYGFFYPTIYSFAYAYFMPQIWWGGSDSELTTLFFIGSFILLSLNAAFLFNFEFLFDLETEKVVEYKLTILPSHFVMFNYLLTSFIFSFVVSLPYFPISYILFRPSIDFSHADLIKVISLLLLSAYFFTCIVFLGFLSIKSSLSVESLWVRLYNPLLLLGGYMVPWYTMSKLSISLKYISLFSPFLYISEGLRGALVGGHKFIPFHVCLIVLGFFCVVSTITIFYLFRKKLDTI